MEIVFEYFDDDHIDPEIPMIGVPLNRPHFESYGLLNEHVIDEPNIKIRYRHLLRPCIKEHYNPNGYTKEDLVRAVISDFEEIYTGPLFDLYLDSMYLVDGIYHAEITYNFVMNEDPPFPQIRF